MRSLDALVNLVESIAQATGATARAVGFVGAIVAALLVGSLVRFATQRLFPTPRSATLLASLKTWWALIAVLLAVAGWGRSGIVLCGAALSWLALREFLQLLPREWTPRPLAVAAYGLIPLQYAWIALGWEGLVFAFVPMAALAGLPAVRMATAPPQGFLASTGAVLLAVIVCVYGLSHIAAFYLLPPSSNPPGGALGWLLFVLVLTEANDMAQAFCGRAFGRRRITPLISPHKTLEGFLGGIAISLGLAILLAPWITPLAAAPARWQNTPGLSLPYLPALVAGAIIAVGGIVGDLTMSSCKRDRGVKDFGDLLPGHGGVLDRFDSLTITAPLFFHWVRFLDY